MGWSIGYDPNTGRDIGYGVPAWCDHPDCDEKIDRGMGYACGGGIEDTCGLYFCPRHGAGSLCERCDDGTGEVNEDCIPFDPSPDHPEWVNHKLTHHSWQQWRDEHPAETQRMRDHAST